MRELRKLLHFYRQHLLEAVVPFWTRPAIDPAGGASPGTPALIRPRRGLAQPREVS